MSAERSAGCDVYMYSLLKQTRQVGDVHECCDVERKLKENRQEYVKVEDVPKRPFSGQFLNRLKNMVSTTIGIPRQSELTFAREMQRKQTDMSIPVIVT